MRPWPGSCGKRWRRAGGRGPLLGETWSIVHAREPDYDAYCIRSSHYLCRVGRTGVHRAPSPTRSASASRRAGSPAEALQTNKTQLAGPCPQWTARETRVLAELHRWQASGLLT